MPFLILKGTIGARGSVVDELTREKINEWFNDMPIDGWVELRDDGHLYIEFFATALRDRGYRPGDFVRIKIVTEEELNERKNSD